MSILVSVSFAAITGACARIPHCLDCSAYRSSEDIAVDGNDHIEAALGRRAGGTLKLAPFAALPTVMTVLIPASLRIVVQVGPDILVKKGDHERFIALGSHLRKDVLCRDLAESRIDHQHVLGISRFSSSQFLDNWKGRRATVRPCPQFACKKSSISSAVVFGSTVTDLSSGAGGALTLAHAVTMSSARAVTTKSPVNASATAEAKRCVNVNLLCCMF